MSIISKIKGFFTSNPAGKDIAAFAGNEFDKAIILAKKTPIGTAAVKAIHDAEDPSLSGAQKMVKALVDVAPVVLEYAISGGFSGAIGDVEQFARAVIESTLADVKATSAATVAKSILKWLGL